MRKFKTAEAKRKSYIYYTAEGKKVELKPGQEGVDELWIDMLHGWDDDEVNADRRERYHCPVSYDSYRDGDGEEEGDRNPYLLDKDHDPSEMMLVSIARAEHFARLEKMMVAFYGLTDKHKETVIKKFCRNMSNVDIAAGEGVSETAIRHRLTRIYVLLREKI